ncbi:MAG: hypothetical protein ACLPT4_08505 [Verrucomicrobiia bacterium]
MAAYRIWRAWVALFLAGYLVLGLATLALPRQEVFPCYSWFLFALVPGREYQYAVRLQEVRGQKLGEPVLFQDADNFVDEPHNVMVRDLVQQWGAAVENGRLDEQARLRRVMEKDYLPTPCRYELVVLTCEPLTRWRTGRYDVRSLEEYTVTGESR